MTAVATATRRDSRPQGRASARPRPADREIVDGLRTRDGDALERLFAEYGGLVAHWARSAGIESDDVVQDVMFRVWKAGARLESDTSLPGYLKTVTQNAVRNRWRTKARKPAVPVGLEPIGDSASDPMLDATERIAIGQALEKLNDRERECLELLYVSDLPLSVVARKLGASPQATKSLAARARRRIRADLEKAAGAEPIVVEPVEPSAPRYRVAHKVASVAIVFLAVGALTYATVGEGSAPAPAAPARALIAPAAPAGTASQEADAQTGTEPYPAEVPVAGPAPSVVAQGDGIPNTGPDMVGNPQGGSGEATVEPAIGQPAAAPDAEKTPADYERCRPETADDGPPQGSPNGPPTTGQGNGGGPGQAPGQIVAATYREDNGPPSHSNAQRPPAATPEPDEPACPDR